MPYDVKKDGNKWVCFNKDTGKVYGRFDTKKEAQDQMKALMANANPKSEKKLTVKIRKSSG